MFDCSAVRFIVSLEKSLTLKDCFKEFDAVMQEYLDLGHAEKVPAEDLDYRAIELVKSDHSLFGDPR